MRLRFRYEDMRFERNPFPARGPEVLSLDELRHYLRKFWSDPVYGIVNVKGAKAAFLRAVGIGSGAFLALFIHEPPGFQFMGRKTQRAISKAVLNVLHGKIHYETDLRRINYAIGVYDPAGQPPQGAPALAREVRFLLHQTRFGPRIARISTGR